MLVSPAPRFVPVLRRDQRGSVEGDRQYHIERQHDGSSFVRFSPTPAWRRPEARTNCTAFAAAADSEVDALILVALYVLAFSASIPSRTERTLVRSSLSCLLYREDLRGRALRSPSSG